MSRPETEKGVTIIDPPEERTLTPKEMTAIKLLLQNYSIAEVRKKLEIGRTTMWKITSDPLFKKKLYEAQEIAFNSSLAVLAGQSRVFAQTLLDVAQNEDEPGSTRVQASRVALANVIQMAEVFQFRERIAALEGALEELLAGFEPV